MKLLALETSTDACSVALSYNGDIIVDHQIAPQKHAQLLLPMIEKILVDAGLKTTDLDGVAFGCGPGSFTGVRIAAATTQGLAFGADIGVIPVSSLQALAQGAHRVCQATHVLAAYDARMSEVYWGAYAVDDQGIAQSVVDDCVCAPGDVPVPNIDSDVEWVMVGSGADQYSEVLGELVNENLRFRHMADYWPNSHDVLTVALPQALAGGLASASDALPVYLRDRVALTEAQRASGEKL